MKGKRRSDAKVRTIEGRIKKKLDIPVTILNPDGSNARSDKKLGTLRKEFKK
jgi:hypothetical protein